MTTNHATSRALRSIMPRLATMLLAAHAAAAGPLADPVQPPPALAGELMAHIDPVRVRHAVEALAGFGTRHTLSETESDTRGIGAARRWLHAQFQSFDDDLPERQDGLARIAVRFEEFEAAPTQRLPAGAKVVNVIAEIPGTRDTGSPRRCYVVAHYDSRAGDVLDPNSNAPGANDDASGTAALLEIARALAANPLESTVVLLATAGEEQGLTGALMHAQDAAGRGDRIVGVLSNDIIGDPSVPPPEVIESGPARTPVDVPDVDHRRVVRLFSEGLPRNPGLDVASRIRAHAGESDSPSRQLARFVAEVARRERTTVQPVLVFRLDRFLRGGDHSAFCDSGFTAVRFTETAEDYSRQHQNVREEAGPDGERRVIGDLPEFVDEAYVADVTRLNMAALVHLANSPDTPANVRIITATLMNDTLLRWDASEWGEATGYEVVWRETTAPEWQYAVDVGAVTEVRLGISKDDYFFGVRAYDAQGYRSPVTFAWSGVE